MVEKWRSRKEKKDKTEKKTMIWQRKEMREQDRMQWKGWIRKGWKKRKQKKEHTE